MNAQLEALLTRTNSNFHFNTEEGTCCLFGIDKNGNAWETDDMDAETLETAEDEAIDYLTEILDQEDSAELEAKAEAETNEIYVNVNPAYLGIEDPVFIASYRSHAEKYLLQIGWDAVHFDAETQDGYATRREIGNMQTQPDPGTTQEMIERSYSECFA